MPLTPEEIRNKSFRAGSTLRRWAEGSYDRTEVDAFLAQVANDYSAAIQKIAVAAQGNIDSSGDIAAEVAEVLRVARESALRIHAKAQEAADKTLTEAQEHAENLRDVSTRIQTVTRSKAETEARKLVEEAEEKARMLLETAEQERHDALEQAQQRYESLTILERRMRERVGALEQLVGEIRDQIEPDEIDLTEEAVGTPVNSEPSGEATPLSEDDKLAPPPPKAERASRAVPDPTGSSEAPASESDKELWELEEGLRAASRRESK